VFEVGVRLWVKVEVRGDVSFGVRVRVRLRDSLDRVRVWVRE